MSRVCCSGVKAWRVLHEGDDLLEVLQRAIDSGSVAAPQEGDVIVVSSKVCGLIEGERFSLASIKVTSPLAAPLATKTMLPPEFIQAILDDADSIVGYAPHVITTMRKGLILPNSGIDRSNSGEGNFIRFPRNTDLTVLKLWREIYRRWGVHVGVIMTDSTVQPLRKGTSGLAVAVCGIKSIVNKLECNDLFGRPLRITNQALADNLSSMAQIVMGEADERCPMALVHGCTVELITSEDSAITTCDTFMPQSQCLYLGNSFITNPQVQAELDSLLRDTNGH